jgi:hypothetical protein
MMQTQPASAQIAYHRHMIASLEQDIDAPDWRLGRNPERVRARYREAIKAHTEIIESLEHGPAS